MSTLQQIRKGMSRALESLQEGWQQLRERASNALTRFSPNMGDAEHRELEAASPRWGLLAAEVREDDDELVVRLEVPGMEKDQFDISLYDDVLVVRGEKHIQREETRGRYHIMERAYGRFERAIPLQAEVDIDRAKAKYKRGVLSIRLPKANRRVRRRIEVKQA
ncbi:MAG TPA: Hsp20/alpha crystallin family protein [Sedimenticola thiotaurini]|uniref:Hsp20/alpha crystallin family protein n=1 Tax=Sedimenticola thiotaurini TaxID=1543721 RepID=A0A831W4Q2_9GAMM|nr:Hsp20/alpha crystallin family protein [Sedimenticola thiotaurini]